MPWLFSWFGSRFDFFLFLQSNLAGGFSENHWKPHQSYLQLFPSWQLTWFFLLGNVAFCYNEILNEFLETWSFKRKEAPFTTCTLSPSSSTTLSALLSSTSISSSHFCKTLSNKSYFVVETFSGLFARDGWLCCSEAILVEEFFDTKTSVK